MLRGDGRRETSAFAARACPRLGAGDRPAVARWGISCTTTSCPVCRIKEEEHSHDYCPHRALRAAKARPPRRSAPRPRSSPRVAAAGCAGASGLRPADRPRCGDGRGRPRRGARFRSTASKRASPISRRRRGGASAIVVSRFWCRSAPARRGRCRACSTPCSMWAAAREATRGLIRMTGNPRFAWDCRRRLLEGYAEIVLGLDRRRSSRNVTS